MTGFGLAWALWAAAAVLTFGVLEYVAVRHNPDRSTLSATLRRWLGIYPRRSWAIAGIAVFLGFLAWLGVHIALGVLPG